MTAERVDPPTTSTRPQVPPTRAPEWGYVVTTDGRVVKVTLTATAGGDTPTDYGRPRPRAASAA